MAKTTGRQQDSSPQPSGALDDELLETEAVEEADEDLVEPDEELSLANREAELAAEPTPDLARRGAPEWVTRNGILRFLYESYYELRYKVTWPRGEEAWQMTLMVIGISAFVALVLGGLDLGLSKALAYVVNLGAGGAHPTPTPTPNPFSPQR